MPYPICSNDDNCRNSQYWKTIPAITALSQYLEMELWKTNYTRLKIIDSIGIMKSSLKDYHCTNHFLCRHGQARNFYIDTTEAGIALANEMISAACEPF